MPTGSLVSATYVNNKIDGFAGTLGISLPHVTASNIINAGYYQNIMNQIQAACAQQGRPDPFASPFDPSQFATGQLIKDWLTSFTIGDVPAPPAQTIQVPDSNYTYTVPNGVKKIMFTWIVGAGGAGGFSNEGNPGGGGGGGGSGAFKRYQEINVVTGDVLSFVIGVGGTPASTGTYNGPANPGTDTIVKKNGNVIFTALGGRGGINSRDQGGGPGGQGGNNGTGSVTPTDTPGDYPGDTGTAGQTGAGDKASSIGGQGGPGPVMGCDVGQGGSTGGGDAYSGASAGKAGVGYGSGGGGAGCKDRTSPGQWAGGAGAPGFVEFTTPSQGATGGTPKRGSTFVADPDCDPVWWVGKDASGTMAAGPYPGKSIAAPTSRGLTATDTVGDPTSSIITGINVDITLRVSSAVPMIEGQQLAIFVNGAGLSESIYYGGPTFVDFVVSNNAQVRFLHGSQGVGQPEGVNGSVTGNFTVTNMSATGGPLVLDTFTSTMTKTGEATPPF